MAIQNLTHLFEVIKTLHFEFIPTSFTKTRLPKIPDSQKYLENPEVFFEQAKISIVLLQNSLSQLKS